MRSRAAFITALALAASGRLGAQNPVQAVLSECPTAAGVFSERQVQVSARFLGDSSRSPRQAPARRESPNVVSFIVDTLGVPEAGSFARERVADSALVEQAARSISLWRFSPALASGCKVRERVVVSVRR